MRGTLLTLTGAAAFCFVAQANAAVIFEDNFDSYATIGDISPTWSATTTASIVTDDNGGNAILMDGSAPNGANNTAIHAITELKPTATESIKLTGRIYDDGAGNKRSAIGFRNGATPLFEMGRYNGLLDTSYAARAVNFPGANPSWVQLSTEGATEGWHLLEAIFTLDNVNVTIDLGSDGTIDGTLDIALDETLWAASPGFVEVRMGGPSGLSSAGGGLAYDNIKLETIAVPEPASLALLGLGSLAFMRRRK
ncbi:hypothetical protein KS4_33220 [Poriferisphaera corsica]|uniref:Ice-binding protein C-terminal domain-containing protein n=1 Tax=Poriferisphaera corsica TaxID=2528020 RepID=A0A517YYE3_9BACT|nr:PEP-CTERM sorting domain-containing protein [Poriferisphaera corsica]QDU35241.1 hypothetical protein KS4_33220 [Poriferisphaera corsica]